MHRLAVVTILALTKISIALPLLLLPLNTSSPNPLSHNVTPLYREPWPEVPWTYVIDDSASIFIERYGRPVCSGDLHCEGRIMDSINQIVRIVNEEYVTGHDEVNSFTSGWVSFWIRQETMVPKMLVEELVATLRWVTLRYGTTELTHAGLLIYGRLAATFELTFPGVAE